MSEVLPVGRMDCLVGDRDDVAVDVVSLSLWLSDSRLVAETGRRLMTAGRSRGGSMSVDVTERVSVIRDCMAAGAVTRPDLSADDESLSSCSGDAGCC